eukprot:CAMPEP_0201673404 /NCGR_PEP_ID=MMETSP0494-20130426/34608_1 /ASSEMBLY_ACC=CAM_ASM_000839 /TAXON_ID=420259 /ORGANISM="Thalassiosira gravida, Strain GMp14c1" /LENGTH=466 /DNA_ID=CAMNT_0048155305 /DNA_START=277 /DNA_END=1677 /DNA_ORIENTATION=+
MANHDSRGGRGGFQRPSLQRQGGVRNITVLDGEPHQQSSSMSPATPSTHSKSTNGESNSVTNPTNNPVSATATTSSSATRKKVVVVIHNKGIRNKLKQDQTIDRLRELQRRFERTTQDATNEAHTDMLDQAQEMIGILSTMQETNEQNESTIKKLQQQLIVVTKDRDAERHNSEELEDKIYEERKSFAQLSYKHKKEVKGWTRKLADLGKKCQQMEIDLKVKDETIKFWGVIRAMSNLGEGTSKAVTPTPDSVTVPLKSKLDGEEKRPLEKTTCETTQVKIENKRLKTEVDFWKGRYEKMDFLNDELLDKIDEITVKNFNLKDVHKKMDVLNDELLDKIGEITDENCKLLTKCENLEGQLASSTTSSLETFQDLPRQVNSSLDTQAENDALHHSMDHAIELASENIAYVYVEKLTTLNNELIQVSLLNDDLLLQNEYLRAKLEETESDMHFHDQKVMSLKGEGMEI